MWGSLIRRFRRAGLEIGPLLGSWKLSVVLMAAGGLYYVFLAIWATSSPPHVVQSIAGFAPFGLVYGLLLVNTAVCLWRRLPGLRRELSKGLVYRSEPPSWERRVPSDEDLEQVGAYLAGQGFKVVEAPGVCGGVKRRWAALGTYLFHGAFFLLALGFLLTWTTRYEATVWVAEGEAFTGSAEQILTRSAPRILSFGPPAIAFTVNRIDPRFWRDQLLFTQLEAELLLEGGDPAVTRINRPLWFGWGTFLRLSGFGYTPRFELLDGGGRVLDSAFAKLNVFPPGRTDFLVAGGYPHRIYVTVYPEGEEEEGIPFTESLNLVDPLYEVRVTRGRLQIAQGLLRAGDELEFEGLRLRLPEIRYWGEFTILRDPGAPLLLLGGLLGIAGLLIKVRGNRAEILWEPGPEGQDGTLKGWGSAVPTDIRDLAGEGNDGVA